MSKMSALALEIDNLFIEGVSMADIATRLNVPIKMVTDHIGEVFNVAEDSEIVKGFDEYEHDEANYDPYSGCDTYETEYL